MTPLDRALDAYGRVTANADPDEPSLEDLVEAPGRAHNLSRQVDPNGVFSTERPAGARYAGEAHAAGRYDEAARWHDDAAGFHRRKAEAGTTSRGARMTLTVRQLHRDAAEAHRLARHAMTVADPFPYLDEPVSRNAHDESYEARLQSRHAVSAHTTRSYRAAAAYHAAARDAHGVAADQAEESGDARRGVHHRYHQLYHDRQVRVYEKSADVLEGHK